MEVNVHFFFTRKRHRFHKPLRRVAAPLNRFGVLRDMKTICNLRGVVAALCMSHVALSATAGSNKMDIVDTAVKAEVFQTLVAAVTVAGLVDTLKGDGPFTVFAPNDEAFSKLPVGTVEDLLKPENLGQLVAVLTYHVVPGKILASDIMGTNEVVTVEGSTVTVKKSYGTVTVDQAKVIQANIEAKNGVIHVIDQVILPN